MIEVFKYTTTCRLVSSYWCFREACCPICQLYRPVRYRQQPPLKRHYLSIRMVSRHSLELSLTLLWATHASQPASHLKRSTDRIFNKKCIKIITSDSLLCHQFCSKMCVLIKLRSKQMWDTKLKLPPRKCELAIGVHLSNCKVQGPYFISLWWADTPLYSQTSCTNTQHPWQ